MRFKAIDRGRREWDNYKEIWTTEPAEYARTHYDTGETKVVGRYLMHLIRRRPDAEILEAE